MGQKRTTFHVSQIDAAPMRPVASHGGAPPMTATLGPIGQSGMLQRQRPMSSRDAQPQPMAPMAPSASHDSRPAWDRFREWADTPLVDVPTLELSDNDMEVVGRELSDNPGAASAYKAALSLGKRVVNIGSDVAESMTTPAGLATMAASLGGSAAGQAGYAGISAGARALEAGISLPYVAEGVRNMASGEPGQAMAGAVQAGLGAVGMKTALSTRGFTPVRYNKDAKFAREVAANSAGDSLTQTAPQEFFQRRSGERVYYGLNTDDTGVDAVALMNNEPGARGAIRQALPDAVKRGATKLDAWAVKSDKYPEGMLPTLYAREGWVVDKVSPYDLSYGAPTEELKKSWRTQGWRDGDAIPDVVYMRRADPAQSGDTSAARAGIPDSQGGRVPTTAGMPGSQESQVPTTQSEPFAQRSTFRRPSSTALSIAAPVGAGMIPDDPDSDVDNYLRAGLMAGGVAGVAAAGWFPTRLKARLDREVAGMRAAQKAEWKAAGNDPKKFQAKDSPIATHIRNVLREHGGNAKEAQRLIDGYETIALPTYQGVNFDDRRPLLSVLAFDKPGTSTTTTVKGERGAKFSSFAKKRLALAYEAGVRRSANESWGDSRYLYHLTNGDPEMAAQITRLFGAFSPGQKTDANTLNGIEAFIRSAMGESSEEILGMRVPDPTRPGKKKRMDGSLSTGHPRPSTVQDNLDRAMQLGRLFQEKVEALSGAEVGLHDSIPIDMWLMRAIGAQSDVTPGRGAYRVIAEAMAKEASARNENPFEYMAKVWMGMQDIAGTPTPSFQASSAKMRLPGHLQDPATRASVLQNIERHGDYVMDRSASTVGEVSPIATNPSMAYPGWLQEVQSLMRAGMDRDVLGKQKVVKKPANISLAKMAKDAGGR